MLRNTFLADNLYIPSDLLGFCTDCFADLNGCVLLTRIAPNPETHRPEPQGLYCPFCEADTALWWFTSQTCWFSIDQDSAREEALAKWAETNVPEEPWHKFTSHTMLCCDNEIEYCCCMEPIFWSTTVRRILGKYDSLDDLYEHYEATQAAFSGQASCITCTHRATPRCKKLRTALVDSVVTVMEHQPITVCNQYSKSNAESALFMS